MRVPIFCRGIPVAALIFVLYLLANASAQNAELAVPLGADPTLNEKHRLGPGDQVAYRVLEDGDEQKALTVTDSGEIEIPYYGRMTAAGKTCKELSVAIRKELEKELYYQATVMIGIQSLNKVRGKVYLVGQIKNPGPQDIPNDEIFTVSKAILKAGGFGEFANQKKVKVIRGGRPGDERDSVGVTVDVAQIWEKGTTAKDVKLEPGDLIFVPANLINF